MAALVPSPAGAAQMLVAYDTQLRLSDLVRMPKEGAVGLLVPDAGPNTSEERVLAALERGAVRNSLLGGDAEGKPRVQLIDNSAPYPDIPRIVVGIPEGGTQPNDKRYPIVVIAPGYRGLLTSQSTRIPGLVSVVDVAPTALRTKGKLRSTPDDDPAKTLLALNRRIDEHRDAKTPVLLASLALLVALAIFRRDAVLPAFAGILLANLALGITGWTNVWVAVLVVALFGAAGVAFARLPVAALGLLLAGVLAAYLVAMWIDTSWVALSPLGPTQNARFYGLSNLLSTLLLVPALAGAAILGGWAAAAVAALALVTVGGSRFGADGGGVLVLLTGYAVLFALTQRPNRRTLLAAAAVIAALAAALALGGSSHVTDAIAGGPAELVEDLWRRLHLSWLRATSGWGVGLLVFGGIAALAVLGLRERRPLLLAYLGALAVSLLVNDSPNDVIVAGLAGYLVLNTAPEVARPAGERATPAAPEPRARSAPAASQ